MEWAPEMHRATEFSGTDVCFYPSSFTHLFSHPCSFVLTVTLEPYKYYFYTIIYTNKMLFSSRCEEEAQRRWRSWNESCLPFVRLSAPDLQEERAGWHAEVNHIAKEIKAILQSLMMLTFNICWLKNPPLHSSSCYYSFCFSPSPFCLDLFLWCSVLMQVNYILFFFCTHT